jgi:hypothetical protein
MAGPINVTVLPIQTVSVQVNKQQNQTVRQLNYGVRTIKDSTDLSLTGATDNDVITYQANTNSFVIKSVGELAPDLDAGFF